jgi:hypothetical protein
MALPKGIKEKVGIVALRDAAKSDFKMDGGEGGPEDEADPAQDDPEEVMEESCCPKCGHKGPAEEFKEEGD